MKAEQLDFEFEKKKSEKKLASLELPTRECSFCGRKTKHSSDGKICLVCGIVNRNR